MDKIIIRTHKKRDSFLTVRIRQEQRERLVNVARDLGVAVGEVARQACEQFVRKYEQRNAHDARRSA